MKSKQVKVDEIHLVGAQRWWAYITIILVALMFLFGLLLQVLSVFGVFDIPFEFYPAPRQEVVEEVGDPRILFVGDVMLDRGVLNRINEYGDGDYRFPFAYAEPVFAEYDHVVANLEGPVSDRGTLVGSKYSFRFPSLVAPVLQEVGIDTVSLANNHIWDYGKEALCDSVVHLHDAGIGTVGAGCTDALANQAHDVVINGVSVRFLSYTNLYPDGLTARGEFPGVSDLDFDRIEGLLGTPGVNIVLMHWGDEYEPRSHPRDQEIARKLIDIGADAVIGHHPHVTQEIETYNNGVIVYSLGNFIFDQYFSEETMRGYAVGLELGETTVNRFEVLPYRLNDQYQPIFRGHEK